MKIYNKFAVVKCVEKEIRHDGKKFNVFVIKDSPAKTCFRRIFVSHSFFEEFTEKERIAFLYHEEYHTKISTLAKFILNSKFFISKKKANHEEEYNADRYASGMIGKDHVISFIKKGSKLYNGLVAYDENTHPSPEDRIKRLKTQ